MRRLLALVRRGMRRLSAYLREVLSDLRNCGARPKAPSKPFGFLTVGAAGLFGAVAPIWGPLHELLKDTLWADQLARSLIPFVLGAVCWHCVRAKDTVELPSQILGAPAERVHSYRFDTWTRGFAKFAAPVLVMLAVKSLLPLIPRCGGEQYAGYICDAKSRKPVKSGTVEPRDALGRVVSVPLSLDDEGWFSIDALGAGLQPEALRLDTEDCPSKELLRSSDFSETTDGCEGGGDPEANRRRHLGPWPTWYVHCDK